jgi:hypothetical protein
LNLILGVMRGFMTIQTTFDADAEDIAEDEIDIMFSVIQIDLQENLRIFFLKTLYTFRNTSDEDLSAYIQIWASEAGRRFVNIGNAGLRSVLQEAADRAVELPKVSGDL